MEEFLNSYLRTIDRVKYGSLLKNKNDLKDPKTTINKKDITIFIEDLLDENECKEII